MDTNPKHEMQNYETTLRFGFQIPSFGIRNSEAFEFRICFGFRYSDFGFFKKPTTTKGSMRTTQ